MSWVSVMCDHAQVMFGCGLAGVLVLVLFFSQSQTHSYTHLFIKNHF